MKLIITRQEVKGGDREMAKTDSKVETKRKKPPAKTPEAREQQLISLATDVAEEQLRNGTASSQVVIHFLKLATTKNELEKEKLRRENELLKAKTENIESQKNIEALYQDAIDAMRSYGGYDTGDEDAPNL